MKLLTTLFLLGVFYSTALGQPSPDNTRVPPGASLNVPNTAYTEWKLGKPDPKYPGYFEVLKSGRSLGAARASHLAYCTGEVYALGRPTSGKGGWWRIAADLLWTNTVALPCDVVVPPPPPPVGGWTKCALESEQCIFKGQKEVRYGLGIYFSRVFTNGVLCSNAIFGDPVPGAPKVCEYRDVDPNAPPPVNITGNPFCEISGVALKQGSPAIDAGALIPGVHCLAAGKGDGRCVEWSGKAPDIGACESVF